MLTQESYNIKGSRASFSDFLGEFLLTFIQEIKQTKYLLLSRQKLMSAVFKYVQNDLNRLSEKVYCWVEITRFFHQKKSRIDKIHKC